MVYRQLVRLTLVWMKGLPYAPLICWERDDLPSTMKSDVIRRQAEHFSTPREICKTIASIAQVWPVTRFWVGIPVWWSTYKAWICLNLCHHGQNQNLVLKHIPIHITQSLKTILTTLRGRRFHNLPIVIIIGQNKTGTTSMAGAFRAIGTNHNTINPFGLKWKKIVVTNGWLGCWGGMTQSMTGHGIELKWFKLLLTGWTTCPLSDSF